MKKPWGILWTRVQSQFFPDVFLSSGIGTWVLFGSRSDEMVLWQVKKVDRKNPNHTINGQTWENCQCKACEIYSLLIICAIVIARSIMVRQSGTDLCRTRGLMTSWSWSRARSRRWWRGWVRLPASAGCRWCTLHLAAWLPVLAHLFEKRRRC